MTLPHLISLAMACAPMVAPQTLLAMVKAESGFDTLVIGVNGGARRRLHPGTSREALALARRLTAAGADFDLGLGQINSRNLGWLGLSLEDAFDPCRNLAAAAKVLVADYAAAPRVLDQQAALRVALSRYNTGDETRGFRNGYVQRVSAAAGYIVPAIQASEIAPASFPAETPSAKPAESLPTAAAPEPPAWDVFASSRTRDVLVFGCTAEKAGRARRAAKTPQARGGRHDP